jgi:Family of unknown function (DUF6364)
MNTKLTLTIEEAIIVKAKNYARSKKSSLSNLIENYLKAVIKEEINEESKTTSIVKSLRGSFKAPKNFDYKAELSKRISEKYL